MSEVKNFGAGLLLGLGFSFAVHTCYGPVINDVSFYESPNGPNIKYVDVVWGRDQALVQNPDGKYTSLQWYLDNSVDKEDRAVEKASIERLIKKERE
ncbi:hypothetical protein HN865_01695 [Candidatus Woesearchaeota archaeon]|jgi:hypothetical protein|nr:hypothetical protein [Candidatus Woesearchaeota archaeon]MBT7237549.1 hypothetical protein [Candidatus Woesearchaeota archaeon]